MKKIIVGTIFTISLILIAARLANLAPNFLGLKENAGIKIVSTPEADVFLDNQPVGKTPYQNDKLEEGEVKVKIQSGELSWEGQVRLSAHTLSSVSRDLAKDSLASAGEILTLEKGEGVTFISSPAGADVSVDGGMLGQTPGSFKVSVGEHTFMITHLGFWDRTIKATVPDGYKLNVAVDLAVAEASQLPASSPPASTTVMLVVKSTPTGFLRVRDKPSVSGKEVAQVKPGDELELLEELSGWDRVKLPDGTVGFVSAQYVSKK